MSSTTAETLVIAGPELEDAGPNRVHVILQDAATEIGHLLDPMVLTKGFEDDLHRHGVSNERLSDLLELEKEVLECPPREEFGGLRSIVLHGLVNLASHHKLDQDGWFSALSLLDSYLAAAPDNRNLLSMLPLSCVAAVRLTKKFYGAVADHHGLTSAQWLDGARQMAVLLRASGHPISSVEFTETMLSQHEIDILQALHWQIDVPLPQQLLTTYCRRFDILTEQNHQSAIDCVKQRSMFFARLFLFVEATSARNPPRETSLGMFCLSLVWCQLLPLECLRPDEVAMADWRSTFTQVSQLFRVALSTPTIGASLFELIQATSAASSSELKAATSQVLQKILQLRATHPAFQRFAS